MARTIRVLLTAAASVLLVFGGAIFSPSARARAPAPYNAKTVAAAQGVQRDYKVPASVALAQSILESGWGDSSLSRDYNNYFGIKCTTTQSPYQAGCVSMRTMEYYASGATYITDGFRTYDTALASFDDYGRLLTSLSRYGNAFKYTANPDQFIREIAQGGYATDPAYADLVIKIMRQYNLYQYDTLPAGTKPTAAATTASATPKVTPSHSASVAAAPSVTPKVTPSASVSAVAAPSVAPKVTPSASVSAVAAPSVTPKVTPSAPAGVVASPTVTAAVTVTPSAPALPTASASASVPPVTGDIDPSSPADITRIVWVIDPDAGKIHFTGPVLNGEDRPYINAAFQIVDTTGAVLGSVTTDAQGWLGDSVTLPAQWDSTTNFEVKIVIPGGVSTQYTEGATTIDTPTAPEPQKTGTLTDADPEVSSSSDTGLDRDRVPDNQAPATAAVPPTAASAPSPAPDTLGSAVVPARTEADAVLPVASAQGSDSAHEAGDQVSIANVSAANLSAANLSAASETPVCPEGVLAVEASGEGTNPVDRTAAYVTARLPRTGGPAAVFGAIGLVATVGGAALLGTSLSGRGRRDVD